MYQVICQDCGKQPLSEENYTKQLNHPNAKWRCPCCGQDAAWDDEGSQITNPPSTILTLRCVVAAMNPNGRPDLFFVKVRCTQEQYDEGEHYEAAQRRAGFEGYDASSVVFDEEDDAGKPLMPLFEWTSASIIELGESRVAKNLSLEEARQCVRNKFLAIHDADSSADFDQWQICDDDRVVATGIETMREACLIEHSVNVLPGVLKALVEARDTFALYAQMHREKGADDKAARNQHLADKCQAEIIKASNVEVPV